MKTSIINAFGRSNRGDSVLLDECIDEIQVKHPGSQIGVLLFDQYKADALPPEVVRLERIGNSEVNSRLLGVLSKVFNLCISMLYAATKFRLLLRLLPDSQARSLKYLQSSDIAVSAPGGYIHDTNFAYIVALANIFIATRLCKRTLLAPQSIGPLKSRLAQRMTRATLNMCDVVCAREGYTLQFLDEIGINQKIIAKCGDSAFWNDHVCHESLESSLDELGLRNQRYIGLTVVNWTFPNGNDPEKLSAEYVQKIAQLIKHLHEISNLKVVIFNQVSDDICMSDRIAESLDHPGYLVIDRIEREPWQLRSLIGKSEIFVGTRFHSCIFAIMASVPTLAISYLPKTQYILQDLQLPNRSTPIDNIDIDFLCRQAMRIYQNRDAESALMRHAVTSYRSSFSRLTDFL